MTVHPQRFYAMKMVMLALDEAQEKSIEQAVEVETENVIELALQYGYSARLCQSEAEEALNLIREWLSRE